MPPKRIKGGDAYASSETLLPRNVSEVTYAVR